MNLRIALGLGLCSWVGCQQPCTEVLSLVPEPVVGEVLYGNNCRTCHGPAGQGDIGPALPTRIPFLDRCDVANVIIQGSGDMPGLGDRLEPQDVADITEYVVLEFR